MPGFDDPLLLLRKFHIAPVQWMQTASLTIRAWGILTLCAIGTRLLAIANLYPFLAVNRPILNADALVIEGWIPDTNLKEAIAEFQQGSYQTLIVTCCPLLYGVYLAGCKDVTELKAETLVALGLSPDALVTLPIPAAAQNRTTTAAIALKDWLCQNAPHIQSINLYSLGPHARRSWKLFQRVLSSRVQVGILAAPPHNYNPDRWWQSSDGARTMISETVGYLYAVLLNRE